MAKLLQIGNQTFEIPEQGDSGWGEETTAYLEAIADALATVQGPEDILLTEALLTNGSSGNISGLTFDTSVVQQVLVEGLIVRTYLDATPTEAEAFVALGSYNGTTFSISVESSGNDTGVSIDIDNTGQFTYDASNKANTDSIVIKFKGKAIIAD
jgi:hypothetical protein